MTRQKIDMKACQRRPTHQKIFFMRWRRAKTKASFAWETAPSPSLPLSKAMHPRLSTSTPYAFRKPKVCFGHISGVGASRTPNRRLSRVISGRATQRKIDLERLGECLRSEEIPKQIGQPAVCRRFIRKSDLHRV